MKKIVTILLFVLVLTSQLTFAYSETLSNSALFNKVAKWGKVRGYDDELVINMPQIFNVLVDDNYSAKNPKNKIRKRLVFSRYINGVILIVDYYEGKTEKLLKKFSKKEKLEKSKSQKLGSFTLTEFSGEINDYYHKKQYYKNTNRLYVVKSVSKSKNNVIVKTFFQSLKLKNGDNTINPNLSKENSELIFPKIFERIEVDTTGKVYNLDEVDRKPITLYLSIPKISRVGKINIRKATVKLNVLYASNGKVKNIKVTRSPSGVLDYFAIKAAKKTKFIPAEKDGKLVSVYQEQTYTMDN